MITPTNLPISIYRNSAFDAEFAFANTDGSAYDLTDWTLWAETVSADSLNVLSFDVDVDAEGGSVVLSLTDAETSAMNVNSKTSYTIRGTAPDGSGPYFFVNGNVQVVDVS
jgi:hypothetical protein